MERRIAKRKFVDVNVYVSLPGHTAMRCAASDISDSGVFLKANPLYLPRRKRLNLVFALRIKSSNVIRMRKVSAVVTRSESGGVGMQFCSNKSILPPG
ncbi:MAG TPA: PilZ domain-containing protein [Gammaproteobacteria bacterium]|nr:PilZ domain-containing protein [Gammaproteobacteria bacterium]